MATVKKIKKIAAGPYNPQKAEAYVGKGVLKFGGKMSAKTGILTPKKSSVSKRLGSAKKSIGNISMRKN